MSNEQSILENVTARVKNILNGTYVCLAYLCRVLLLCNSISFIWLQCTGPF